MCATTVSTHFSVSQGNTNLTFPKFSSLSFLPDLSFSLVKYIGPPKSTRHPWLEWLIRSFLGTLSLILYIFIHLLLLRISLVHPHLSSLSLLFLGSRHHFLPEMCKKNASIFPLFILSLVHMWLHFIKHKSDFLKNTWWLTTSMPIFSAMALKLFIITSQVY